MNSREVTKNYRLSKWTEIIRECHNSGQTVTAWCADHDINTRNYYYWLRCVRMAASEVLPAQCSGNNPIVELNIPVNKTESFSTDKVLSSEIILHFGSITLELHNNASAALIENTLRALQNVR